MYVCIGVCVYVLEGAPNDAWLAFDSTALLLSSLLAGRGAALVMRLHPGRRLPAPVARSGAAPSPVRPREGGPRCPACAEAPFRQSPPASHFPRSRHRDCPTHAPYSELVGLWWDIFEGRHAVQPPATLADCGLEVT